MAATATLTTPAQPALPTVKAGHRFTVTGTVVDPDGVQDPVVVGSCTTTPVTFGDLVNEDSAGFLGMARLTIRNEPEHTYYDYVFKPTANNHTAGQKVWVAHMASPTGIPYDDSNVLLDVVGPFVVAA